MALIDDYVAKREARSPHGSWEGVREVDVDGHRVAWVHYAYDHGDRGIFEGHTLVCDCEVTPVDRATYRGNMSGEAGSDVWYADGRDCPYRAAAETLVQLEARRALEEEFDDDNSFLKIRGSMDYHFRPERFEGMILKLLEWHNEGRWIGQGNSGMLYWQPIARILSVSDSVMSQVCQQMFKEKKIGMTGAIISVYDPERDEPRDDDDSKLDDSRPPFPNEGEPIEGKLFFHSETGTEGGYWALQEDGRESYDGLHILRTGDWLEVGAGEATLFSGYIRLRHYNLFTEDARGLWIHADQRGVDREEWATMFFNAMPARLIPRQGD